MALTKEQHVHERLKNKGFQIDELEEYSDQLS